MKQFTVYVVKSNLWFFVGTSLMGKTHFAEHITNAQYTDISSFEQAMSLILAGDRMNIYIFNDTLLAMKVYAAIKGEQI